MSFVLDPGDRALFFTGVLRAGHHGAADHRRALAHGAEGDAERDQEGALALGATRWEVIRQITLPMASTGIVGAAVLALGRAMGETMALAMLIGNKSQISASLFAPANTIASLLANSFGEADGLQISALMYLSFILMVLTLAVNAIAEWVLDYTGATKRHV